METKTVAVDARHLQIGMRVFALDRPWIETPFLLQGFIIGKPEEITILQNHCEYVYIDVASLPQDFNHKNSLTVKNTALKEPIEKLTKKPDQYPETITFEEELENAKSIKQRFSTDVSAIFKNIIDSASLDINQVKKAVDPMLKSVIRNPDAMIWLARLRSKDDYSYRHAMSVSIWSVSLGRHLGLPLEELNDLASGALLADIGKLDIPSELLNKKETLSDEEVGRLKAHVCSGITIINNSKNVPKHIRDIIQSHHERHTGLGYPNGLAGAEIPLFARIVGLVDCYDAIISQRAYAPALSSNEAVKILYQLRDTDFQAELIEEFIQSIGIYPAGSLIELTDDTVAVVVASGRKQRLRPKIMRVLDAQKQPFRPLKIIDLMTNTTDENGQPLHIHKSLPSDAYGIDPAEFYI